MDQQPVYRPKTVRLFALIYAATLLFSIHFFFIYFVSSSYLDTYVKSTVVGLFYSLGALINLFVFLNIGKILNRLGNYRLMLGLIFLEFVSLFGIAFGGNIYIVGFFFIISQAINPILLFNLDIFLENYSKNEETGSIRGVFLTIDNLPPVFVPFIAGLILTRLEYWKVYIAGAVFLIPLFYIIANTFKNFKDPLYHETTSANLSKEVVDRPDVYDILFDNFLLNFYYAWMVIYMPIYLHYYIGFNWPEIGVMFSIMLLPFIIFQIPLGRLEDRKYGEQEILIIGFVIVSICTILIPYLNSANFLLWTLLLFLTRVGASFIEISAETYFFKQVSTINIHLIGLFRMTRNLPFLFVPAIVSLALLFMDFRYIFLVLGLIMLTGIRYAFLLKDTK
jgi:MFS family permease